jgi:cysteine desulfurase
MSTGIGLRSISIQNDNTAIFASRLCTLGKGGQTGGETMIYLDANASEPLRPEAEAALLTALKQLGNPSSTHGAGRAARRLLEDARESLAHRFGSRPANLVFTSGGTEADALAVHGLGAGRRVVIGATEHDAIRAAAPDATVVPVGADGRADLGSLNALLADGPALVCLMHANNETGILHPISEVSGVCRRHGAWLHVDAVQSAGRLPVDLAALGADSMAISAHKLGGLPGAGALLLSEAAAEALRPLIRGGGQERGRRGGTPPVATIAAFAAAAGAPTADLAPLRDAIEAEAIACGAEPVAPGAPRLPNTTSLVLPGVASETQVIALDLAGVAVSAGAACSSGKVSRSHVLEAMGLGARAGQAVRVSLPWSATWADVDAFATAYRTVAARLLRRVG